MAVQKESYVITKGIKKTIKHSPSNKSENKQEKSILDDEARKAVESILGHELYTQHTKGQERIDGILGELTEQNIINKDQHEKLVGKKLKLESADDVEKLLQDERKSK